jgi:hypothetical protein
MDSDVIRQEIDRTSRRIEQTAQLLARRTREISRTAVTWAVIGATTVAIGTAVVAGIVWYRRRRGESAPHPRQAPLPFGRVRISRGGAESRPSA